MTLLITVVRCAIFVLITYKTICYDYQPVIKTTVSYRISKENDLRRLMRDLEHPTTLLIPSGYLIILCQYFENCTSPNKLHVHYPDGKRVKYDPYNRAGDHRIRFPFDNTVVAFIAINSKMRLGSYKCSCYDSMWTNFNDNSSTESTGDWNEHIVGSVDVLYRPCVMPVDECSHMNNCSKKLSQLMGCVVVHDGINGQKCQQLTTKHCSGIHAPEFRLAYEHEFVVCTVNGKQYSSVCEAVSSANEDMSLPILYLRHGEQCPSKNEDEVFPNALYWQQVDDQTECDLTYKHQWKLVPLQSYVLAILHFPVILCYVCHKSNLIVRILDDPSYPQEPDHTLRYMYEPDTIYREMPCSRMGKSSWIATISFVVHYKYTEGIISTSHVKIDSGDSYVDVMYVIEKKPIEATITKPSVIRHRTPVECYHDYVRLKNYPANGFMAYELECPAGKAIMYSDIVSRLSSYELTVTGLLKCTVMLQSCYYRTENNTLTQSTAEFYAEIKQDRSVLYLNLAIAMLCILILSVLIFLSVDLCKKKMAERRFFYLIGGGTVTGEEYQEDSYKEKAHRSTTRSTSPSRFRSASPQQISTAAKKAKK